jgi:hypothetical protein
MRPKNRCVKSGSDGRRLIFWKRIACTIARLPGCAVARRLIVSYNNNPYVVTLPIKNAAD